MEQEPIKEPDKEEKIKRVADPPHLVKTIKVPLNRVILNDNIKTTINDLVDRVNLIVGHVYQFLKLYYVDKCINDPKNIPELNTNFIYTIFDIFTFSDNKKGVKNKENKELYNKLLKYRQDNYDDLMVTEIIVNKAKLQNILKYEASEIITNLKNHIKEHSIDMLNRVINILTNKDAYEKDIKDNKLLSKPTQDAIINKFRAQLKVIKHKICNYPAYSIKTFPTFTYEEQLVTINNKKFIKKQVNKQINYRIIELKKRKLIKLKNTILDIINEVIDLEDKPIDYYIKSEPFTILQILIKLQILCSSKRPEIKNINCFPLRTSLIPKYITLDTFTILDNFVDNKEEHKKFRLNINYNKSCIWNYAVRIDRKYFKLKDYKFGHIIQTDGINCSVIFKKFIDKEIEIEKDDNKNDIKKKIKESKKEKNITKYVQALTKKEKDNILYKKNGKERTLVGLDPGHNDIFYATNGKTKIETRKNGELRHKTETFRYSQYQRKTELQVKANREKLENNKENSIINEETLYGYNETNVKEVETRLSKYDSKSCILTNIKEYIKNKNIINNTLKDYYNRGIHRRKKMSQYILKQKSESKMINNFKNKFGSPEDVILLYGDYSQHQIKNKEPTKGKSMRKLFKDHGYKVYLVNEYNTSKKSFIDGKDMEKFKEKKGINKKEEEYTYLCHGLLRSKNDTKSKTNETQKSVIMNRDLNGSMNILLKGRCILTNKEVPKHLTQKT